MSILVVCNGCRKRFSVKDKFAGKTGRCPNCKQPITVPGKAEVVIHEPEQFDRGGRGTSGQLVLQPILREEIKFNPLTAAAIASAAAIIFAAAFLGGKIALFAGSPLLAALGLTLISPLVALAGYSFLYDDSLEPHKGGPLLIRSAICGLMYALLWGAFAYLSDIVLTGEVWNWLFIAPPFLVCGAMVAVTSLDLEYGNGFLHYSFYLLVTIFLRWMAGMGWIWNIK
jgi:hypothetical protein